MENIETSSLDESKKRITAAFSHLEQAIELRVKNALRSAALATPTALADNSAKTEALTANLTQLTADYNNLKQASSEVLAQLNQSIQYLETLLSNKLPN